MGSPLGTSSFLDESREFASSSAAASGQGPAVLCPLCQRDLSELSGTRRQIHTDRCLGEADVAAEAGRKRCEWEETVDCPLCSAPLHPGPFQAAHAKTCAKAHGLKPTDFLHLLNTQRKVAGARKSKGLAHTSAALPPKPTLKKVRAAERARDPLLPSSSRDEEDQLAKALSLSLAQDQPSSSSAKPSSRLTSKPSHGSRPDIGLSTGSPLRSHLDSRLAAFFHSASEDSARALRAPPSQLAGLIPSSPQASGSEQVQSHTPEKVAVTEETEKGSTGSPVCDEKEPTVSTVSEVKELPTVDKTIDLCEEEPESASPGVLETSAPASDPMNETRISDMEDGEDDPLNQPILEVSGDEEAELPADQPLWTPSPDRVGASATDVGEKVPVMERSWTEPSPLPSPGYTEWVEDASLASPSATTDSAAATGFAVQASVSCEVIQDSGRGDDDGGGGLGGGEAFALDCPSPGFTDYVEMEPQASPVTAAVASPATSIQQVVAPADSVGTNRWAEPAHPSAQTPKVVGRCVGRGEARKRPAAEVAGQATPRTALVSLLGPGVKVLKTANVTPEPDFAGMGSPALRAELLNHGIRPLPKKRAVAMLRKVYQATHPELPAEIPPELLEGAGPARPPPFPRAQLSGDGDSGESSGEEGDEEEEDGDGSTAPGVLDTLAAAIRASPALYQKVLLMEVVELEEVQALLSQHSLTLSLPNLQNFLDDNHVTWAYTQPHTFGRRKPRPKPRSNAS